MKRWSMASLAALAASAVPVVMFFGAAAPASASTVVYGNGGDMVSSHENKLPAQLREDHINALVQDTAYPTLAAYTYPSEDNGSASSIYPAAYDYYYGAGVDGYYGDLNGYLGAAQSAVVPVNTAAYRFDQDNGYPYTNGYTYAPFYSWY